MGIYDPIGSPDKLVSRINDPSGSLDKKYKDGSMISYDLGFRSQGSGSRSWDLDPGSEIQISDPLTCLLNTLFSPLVTWNQCQLVTNGEKWDIKPTGQNVTWTILESFDDNNVLEVFVLILKMFTLQTNSCLQMRQVFMLSSVIFTILEQKHNITKCEFNYLGIQYLFI